MRVALERGVYAVAEVFILIWPTLWFVAPIDGGWAVLLLGAAVFVAGASGGYLFDLACVSVLFIVVAVGVLLFLAGLWLGRRVYAAYQWCENLIWRVRLTLIVRRQPYGWDWREAWGYAGSILDMELDCAGDDPIQSPRDALDSDRQYWEN